MEYVKDTVQVIAEGQQAMGEKFERRFNEADVKFNKFAQETQANFKTVFDYLSGIDDELKEIKNEVVDLKEKLKSKTDLIRLETLESRVEKIEKELVHLR